MSIDKRLISTGAAPAGCTTDTLDIFGDSSCVALYGLNYDGSDASGNYDGTPTSVDFNAPGYIDYAASFNGSSSKVQLPQTYGAEGETFSYSLWFNTDSADGSYMFAKRTGNNTFNIRIDNSFSPAGKICVNNWAGTAQPANNAQSTNGGYNDNTWHHFVFTYDGTRSPKTQCYIDGQRDTNMNWDYDLVSQSVTNGNNIGNYDLNGANFSGKIDQVRIFNKALSSSEVTTLYGEVACGYTCTTDTNGFPASASSDLVAYYKLDNDATDETGSYNGTATDVTFDGGRYGSSAVFNGSSSFINTGISNTTIPLSSDFSISAWINTNSSSGFFIAEGNFNSWNTAGFGLGIVSSNRVELSFGNVAPSGGPQVQSSALAADTWYHIVGVVDLGNVLTLYVNGISVGTNVITAGNRTNVSGGFNIGRDAGGYDYTGKLDQVRFYTKALSSTEVSTIYEDEHQCYITVDSTDPFGDSSNIALYEFENNANDSTGSYNGTASNVTYSTDSIIGTYAGSFNGSSSVITLPILNVSGSQSRTISAWINTQSIVNYQTIYNSGGSNSLESFNVGTKDSRIYFSSLNADFETNTGVLSTNTWYNVVVTYNGGLISTQSLKIYVNGINQNTTKLGGSTSVLNTTNLNYSIGKRTTFNDNYFNGSIDQVRIFNTALDGDEVWKLYAEGAKG